MIPRSRRDKPKGDGAVKKIYPYSCPYTYMPRYIDCLRGYLRTRLPIYILAGNNIFLW